MFLASLARWRNQRERAWWRRVQPDQCSAWPGGLSVAAASRRLTSGTVSGIIPGSGGGGWSGLTGGGGGACVSVRSFSKAAVMPGADQRVAGLLPDVRQVHGVDPVLHPAGTPHVLPLDAAGGLAFLLLTGLIQRPDPHGPPPAGPPGGLIQASHHEPAHYPHRGERVPGGGFSSR
jgi:hypothetical protein